MNILIELGINSDAKRGIDAYYEGLIQGLAEIDSENQYALFAYFYNDFERKLKRLPQPPAPNFRLIGRKWPERVVHPLERAGIPVIDGLVVRPGKFSIYHSTGALPKIRSARTVVTVCDLLYEIYHERALRAGRTPDVFPSGVVGEAARKADRVITISECTKKDLVRFYGIDPDKVTPILLGVDHKIFRPSTDDGALRRVRKQYGLPEPYALFMGPFEPRRNAELGLSALAALRKQGIGRDCGLVFAGKPNEHLDVLRALVEKLGMNGNVRELGYVPREDLPAIYQQAFVFIHPEIYDGFSLPLLEAMASGAPVLSSSSSALPEIVGDAGLVVDPEDQAGAVEALRALFQKPELGKELREKGMARAKEFTWRKTAERTLRVYEELARTR